MSPDAPARRDGTGTGLSRVPVFAFAVRAL